MNRIQTAAIALTVALSAVAGAQAQDKMMGAMTKEQTTKWAACQKMTKDMMMKDAECTKLSKMHSDSMMKSDGGMMKDKPKGAM